MTVEDMHRQLARYFTDYTCITVAKGFRPNDILAECHIRLREGEAENMGPWKDCEVKYCDIFKDSIWLTI